MEEAFAQLYQEFQQLQDLCARQAELLQKLTGKKSPNIDMPVSMPIQCTDAGESNRKEDCISGSPGKAVHGEASEQAAPKSFRPMSADTNHCPANSALPLKFNNYHLFCHKTEKDRSILGLYNQDVLMNKAGSELDVGEGLQHYKATKIASETPKEKATFSPIPQDFPFLDLNDSAEFCSFSDIYNVPHSLPSEVATDDYKPIGDKFPLEVRGPAQNSWSPTCMSEDCSLGVGAKMSSESFGISSQTCEFCQAVFPAGSATKGEYLWHLTGHVE